MTDERGRGQHELRAFLAHFLAQFDGWAIIVVALTLGAAVLTVGVAVAMLIPARY
jgi:hypothetical protein